jgi:hypothetical protein
MKMKPNKLLLAIAVAAVAAAPLAPLSAAEPFLSPKAKANQIRTVPGVTEEKLDRANLFKPKSAFVGNTVARGSGSDRNLVTEGRHITASPKALAAHPELFQRGVKPATALAACCKTTTKDECGMACCKDTGAKCGGACCKS